MTLKEYSKKAQEFAIYPNRDTDITYPLLGFFDELGEVAGKIKKLIRDSDYYTTKFISKEKSGEILKELGDVLWYINELDIYGQHQLLSKNYTGVDYSKEISLEEAMIKLMLFLNFNGHRSDLSHALGFLNYVSSVLGSNLNEVAKMNIDKLSSRKERNVISGSGDNR